MSGEFTWIPFYMEFANKLRGYKERRSELVEIIKKVYETAKIKLPTLEKDGAVFDIDPFTVFGLFNKGITDKNRIAIAAGFKDTLGISADVPSDFNGIPILNPQMATFYWFEGNRGESDIDNLWEMFIAALEYSNEKSDSNKENFRKWYEIVIRQKGIKWNLTMGLFWIRPFVYLSLDDINRKYILESDNRSAAFKDFIKKKVKKSTPTSSEVYLSLCEHMRDEIKNHNEEYYDFPSFSYFVWKKNESKKKDNETKENNKKSENNRKQTDNNISSTSNAEFLRFFSPLIQALKELGGSASKKNACDRVIEIMKITGDELTVVYENSGEKKVENQIAWARNYLFYEGFISNENRGIWRLTDLGMKIDMTMDLASHIFKKWVAIKSAEGKGLPIPDINISQYYKFLPQHENYTKEQFLSDVFLPEKEYDKLAALLLRKKNIILQGAPGVGKTYSAKRLAYSIIGEKNESRICMVQFHQSYSYEDFVYGYRPTDGGGFKPRSGVFYDFCERCKEYPDKPYFFIIDEINRGNLSKIFGELLMLIENDKRGEDNKINLVYGGEQFYIPETLYIIGLMNTADRSLAMIDYALRRRFSFYTMQPAFENADTNGFSDYVSDIECELYHKTIEKVKEINREIRKDTSLGKGFEIGHSYFAPQKKSIIDDEWVRGVIEYEIIPLIEEYWFDDDKTSEKWIAEFRQITGE